MKTHKGSWTLPDYSLKNRLQIHSNLFASNDRERTKKESKKNRSRVNKKVPRVRTFDGQAWN